MQSAKKNITYIDLILIQDVIILLQTEKSLDCLFQMTKTKAFHVA